MEDTPAADHTSYRGYPVEQFDAHFQRERVLFDIRRAQLAASELVRNKRALGASLTDCLRFQQRGEVLSESAEGEGSSSEATGRVRTSKRSRSKRSTEKLERGSITGVKLNVKTSSSPRFRKQYCFPMASAIPLYTSWNFVSANQQHQKVRNQKRLFYTDDDTGETMPASDDEKESQPSSFCKWDGMDVEWREHCLVTLGRQFGHLPSFSHLLAEKLEMEPLAVVDRWRKFSVPDPIQETTTQLCRRCLQYNCSLHPESDVLPMMQPPPEHQTNGNVCGLHCWLRKPPETAQTMTRSRERGPTMRSDTLNLRRASSIEQVRNADENEEEQWTAEDVQLLEKGFDIYGDNSCELKKFVFMKTCAEIHRYLVTHPDLRTRRLAQLPRRRKMSRKISSGNRKGAPVVAKRLKHRESELWHQYLPCACKSNCSNCCPCVKSKNFCDKYCACWNGAKWTRKACGNAWKGCKCTQRCDTQRCPCVAAARECDPDLCSQCSCDGNVQCRNMSIRTGKQKRVAMGLSHIVGWGTFMLEDVKKDELIGEYTGEIVSDDEAERRGRIYDIEDKSYLFSATSETVIDANHRGNKLRFANHSADANCYVKYLLVDGDYRVGIFACRDIFAGEELLYNYGESFRSNWNPPWIEQRTSGSAPSSVSQ